MHKGLTLPRICVDRADDGKAREKTKFWGRQSLPKGEGGQSEPTARERQLPNIHSSWICNIFNSWALHCLLASQINCENARPGQINTGYFFIALPYSKKLWICQKLILKKGDRMIILGGENEKPVFQPMAEPTSNQFLSGKVKTIYPSTPFHAFLRVRELWTEYQLTMYHLSAHWRRHQVYIAFLGPYSRQSLPFKAKEVSVHSFANVLGGEECWISRCRRTLANELEVLEVYLVMAEGRGKVAEERDVTWAKLVRKGLDMQCSPSKTEPTILGGLHSRETSCHLPDYKQCQALTRASPSQSSEWLRWPAFMAREALNL